VEEWRMALGIEQGIVSPDAQGVIFSTSANLCRSCTHC
jgi:hypothetical protein